MPLDHTSDKQDADEIIHIGPIHTPSAEIFDDFDDEHGQNLLGSLQLDAEEEPVRRGASRANSVRFDVSAIQGSNCAQGSRASGEFGLIRPSSGLGSHPMMERSLSHKSDGRHSSAGHSIHSVHSALSGRTSSFGLDTNFVMGAHNDDSALDTKEPPPGLFILGTVPSIIRCWLNENFSHGALLYAVVCTGSQYSHIDISLVKELGLINQLQRNVSGNDCIKLPVYLPEALVTQSTSRTSSPAPQLPTLTATFIIFGTSQRSNSEAKRAIRIFLGSDTLRAYSADILFSQNLMTLYGDHHNRLSVPFVRPEDEAIFKNLRTAVIAPELKTTAPPFTPTEQKLKDIASIDIPGEVSVEIVKVQADQLPLGNATSAPCLKTAVPVLVDSESKKQAPGNGTKQSTANGVVSPQGLDDSDVEETAVDDDHQEDLRNDHVADASPTDQDNHVSPKIIWGTWRAGGFCTNDSDTNGEHISTSGYQRPSRGGRSMKVLKPSKTSQRGRSSSAARTGASYEPPVQHISGEFRRKSQAGPSDSNGPLRWEAKRTVSDEKTTNGSRLVTNISKSSNPIGGASAFAWMNPGKVITTSARAD
jgi:hypothetical protein